VAETGAALDRVLAEQRPDLVILDLMLPGEDGPLDLPPPAQARHESPS
jgi:DNA-binding response OmpR family regulator